MDEYISEIIFWIGTAVSALAGTGLTFGMFFKAVSKLITAIKLSKGDYDSSTKKIDDLADKLISGSKEIEKIGQELDETRKKLEETTKSYEQIKDVLYTMAINDVDMISNGSSKQISQILGKVDETITKVDINE